MLQIVAASAGVVLMHARTDCLFHLGAILYLCRVGIPGTCSGQLDRVVDREVGRFH